MFCYFFYNFSFSILCLKVVHTDSDGLKNSDYFYLTSYRHDCLPGLPQGLWGYSDLLVIMVCWVLHENPKITHERNYCLVEN